MMHISESVLNAGASLFSDKPEALHLIERGGAPDGVVYTLEQDGHAFIMKFIPTNHAAVPAIQDKIAFVSYLRENGVKVPDYLPSVNNQLVEIIEIDGLVYAVTKAIKAPGFHPNIWNPEHFSRHFWEEWGRMIGQMHALSQRYEGGTHIPRWQQEHAFFANWCQDDEVGEKWRQIGEKLRLLPEPRDAFGLIHNDPHPWNFLIDGESLTVLDFDVCSHHWFMTDIAIALFHPIWERRNKERHEIEAFAKPFIATFLEGYSRENTLDDFWFQQLPTFVRYRQMLFYIAMMGENGQNPDAKPFFDELKQSIVNELPITGFDF
jgi:Ser/Thr protein kinase RdoA (MazF antagonist)